VVVVSLATALVCAVPVRAAAPVEVNTCGQQVPKGANAYLNVDLTCPFETNAVAIRLGGGATLDLQGHTVTGGIAAVACGDVLCVGDWCGPTRKAGKCEIKNGTITGAHYEAVSGGKVVIRNMTLVDNGAYGVLAHHRVEVFDSHVGQSRNGVQANKLIVVRNSTFDAASVQGANKIVLDASSVTHDYTIAISGKRVRLQNGSSVVGNVPYAECEALEVACPDIISERAPWLDGASSCGTSLRSDSLSGGSTPMTWGVCIND
jgi:hypothetical protein